MLKSFFSRQARNPSGLFGRFFMSKVFDKGNAPLNNRMLELVAASGDQRILEIGFGTGECVRAMARSLAGGCIEGVDTSEAMLRMARRRNRDHLKTGVVRLVLGDFDALDYPSGSYDTVCSANTVYFWPDPGATLRKIHGLLRPGGRLILAFVDKAKMEGMPLDMDVFTPMSHQDLRALLGQAGFAPVTRHIVDGNEAMVCMAARKA